jgi:hypothetical protein
MIKYPSTLKADVEMAPLYLGKITTVTAGRAKRAISRRNQGSNSQQSIRREGEMRRWREWRENRRFAGILKHETWRTQGSKRDNGCGQSSATAVFLARETK